MTFILGAGFVGSKLLAALSTYEGDLIASTTSFDKKELLLPFATEVVVMKGDDEEKLKEILPRIHVAVILVAPSSGVAYEDVYVKTAEAVAKVLQGRCTPLYLLQASSTFVYAGVDAPFATEDLILHPSHHKAKLLLSVEKQYLNLQSEHVKVCVLRLGGIYGPMRKLGDRARFVSGRELAGSGDEPTNHIHVDDVVRCIDFCIKNQLCGIYNCVNDSHPTKKELYETLCRDSRLPLPIWNPTKEAEHGCGVAVSHDKLIECGFRFDHPTI
jgi:nucleoside-diphosphate-sugar epimerase